MLIESMLAVPIKEPNFPLKQEPMKEHYFFIKKLYTKYSLTLNSNKYIFFQDDRNKWYFIYTFSHLSLNQLKLSRQILRPSYLHDVDLPLINLMNSLGLIVDTKFDKAYGHALFYCDNLENISTDFQMKIANFDGDDDPSVSSTMHYIENRYNKKITRFIAGVETYSFATVTESKEYADDIWKKETGLLYLLLFVYFQNYNSIPTKQMMGRLLCNLWSSTQSFNQNYNVSLFRKIKL